MTTTHTHGIYRGKKLIDIGSEGELQRWASNDEPNTTPPLKVYRVKVTRVERKKSAKKKGSR